MGHHGSVARFPIAKGPGVGHVAARRDGGRQRGGVAKRCRAIIVCSQPRDGGIGGIERPTQDVVIFPRAPCCGCKPNPCPAAIQTQDVHQIHSDLQNGGCEIIQENLYGPRHIFDFCAVDVPI